MNRALRVILEAFRGGRDRVSQDESASNETTLYIDKAGTSVAIAIPLLSGDTITVLHDGTITGPDGVPAAAIETGLESAREQLREAGLLPWF